mgnify:FL=1
MSTFVVTTNSGQYESYDVEHFFEADSKEEVQLFLLNCYEARKEFLKKNESRSLPPEYKGNLASPFNREAHRKWHDEVHSPWFVKVYIPYRDEMHAQFWWPIDIDLYLSYCTGEFVENRVQTLEEYIQSQSIINVKEALK